MIDYDLKSFNNIMKAFNNKTLENYGVNDIILHNNKITQLIITINPKYGFHKDTPFDLHINFEVNYCNYPSFKITNSVLFNSIFTTQHKNKDKYTIYRNIRQQNDKGVHPSPGLHLLVQLPLLDLFIKC